MGSFVPSNVSIYDILNFTGRGKCNTQAVNGDSVCCIRMSMETGANKCAHVLAKHACFNASFYESFVIPSWLEKVFISDLLST